MARVVAVCGDLLLGSKVEAMLGAAGHEVSLHPTLSDASFDGAELLVVDLETTPPDSLADLGIPVLGFYSHVDVEAKRAADDAGLDLAVPRSRMARELPALVEGLLSDRSG